MQAALPFNNNQPKIGKLNQGLILVLQWGQVELGVIRLNLALLLIRLFKLSAILYAAFSLPLVLHHFWRQINHHI